MVQTRISIPRTGLALVGAALLVAAFSSSLLSAGPVEEERDTCLGCHGDQTASKDLPDGTKVSLFVDVSSLDNSVHGTRVKCSDCHPGTEEVPHPERPVKNLREYQASFREACRRCHFDNYTKTLDSVHYTQIAKGDLRAPFCVDCHGSHAITRPTQPKPDISKTCARCHEKIFEVYKKSVHGKAFVAHNPDVPVCTDCHKSHDIANPHSAAYRLRTPQICGSCHTNKAVMAKYKLSTDVLSTYLADFHGMSASLEKGQTKNQRAVVAVCVDCHGVHDITTVKGEGSRVVKANLLRTCRQCHKDASENFPAAWLSHYEPSWKRAPLIYGITLFYKVLIPFIIGGLVLQILLHLWRVVVNR